MKKATLLIAAVMLVLSSVFLTVEPLIQQVFSQSTSCDALPAVSLKQNVSIEGEYRIWLLAKKESTSAIPYVKVDNGVCRQVSLPTTNDWQWVGGRSGAITQNLTEGEHNFTFSVDNGAVLLDKVLVTSDLECVPTGDGGNCVQDPLNFVVVGISDGEIVNGSRTVSAQLSNTTYQYATVEFYIDDKLVGKQGAAPYCLVDTSATDTTCTGYDFNALGNGDHKLKVVATSNNGLTEQSIISFKVDSSAEQPGSGEGETIPTDPNTGETTELLPPVNLEVVGISPNEEVKGKKEIYAKVSGTDKPVAVKFAIGQNEIATRTAAPYCMKFERADDKDSDDADEDLCDEWDSRTVANGEYIMYITATSAGRQPKNVQIKFTVKNPTVIVSTKKIHRKKVVIGRHKQTATGRVRVEIPQQRAYLGSMIIYRINDKEIARTFSTDPSAEIDTRDYPNGTVVLSATIVSPSGEEEVITSELSVKNDLLTGTANWLKANAVIMVGTTIVTAAVLLFGSKYLYGKYKSKKFIHEHNLDAPHQFNQSGSQLRKILSSNYAHAAMALFAVAIGVFAIVQLGTPSASAAGVGFIANIDDGSIINAPAGFDGHTVAWSADMTTRYARLNYSSVNTTPVVTPGTEVFKFQGESMTIPAGTGIVLADTGADGSQSTIVWGNGYINKTVTTGAAKGITVRVRGDQCNGAPIMLVKLDGNVVFSTSITSTDWAEYSYGVNIAAGSHAFEVGMTNDYFPNDSCDRNIYVDYVSLPTSTPTNAPAAIPTTEPEVLPNNPTTPTTPPTTPTTPTTPPSSGSSSEVSINFDGGTNAASVGMVDIVNPGPHGSCCTDKLTIRDGAVVDGNPDSLTFDMYAAVNKDFSNDQYAEADVYVGSSTADTNTGVFVRANTTGPMYSWYKFEFFGNSSQVRLLPLIDNAIYRPEETYVNVPGGIQLYTTYRLKLVAQGNRIMGYVNDNLLIDIQGGAITSGRPGVNIHGAYTTIDNFKAGNYPPTSGSTTPSTPPSSPSSTDTLPTISINTPTNCTTVSGIATDVDWPAGGLRVHIRFDTDWPTKPGPDQEVFTDSSGKWSWTIPSTYKDTSAHKIYVGVENKNSAGTSTNTWGDGAANNGVTFGPCVTNSTPPPATTPTTPTTPPTTTHTGTHTGPHINDSTLPASVSGMGSELIQYGAYTPEYKDGVGAFRTRCFYSHVAYDDPLVFPNQPGASHLHTFFGNTSANAYSDVTKLETVGNSTCHGGILNRSAYWVPSMIDASGNVVIPVAITAYYKTGYGGVPASQVSQLPAGLRMIAGNASATTPYSDSWSSPIHWTCIAEWNGGLGITPGQPGIHSCPQQGGVFLAQQIKFPQCWNGQLDSWNHKDHLAYPNGGCPASHPTAIPEITFNVLYQPRSDMASWRLSSDNYTGNQGGYSSHADWVNGWNQTIVAQYRDDCWATGLDCGVDFTARSILKCQRNTLLPEYYLDYCKNW